MFLFSNSHHYNFQFAEGQEEEVESDSDSEEEVEDSPELDEELHKEIAKKMQVSYSFVLSK